MSLVSACIRAQLFRNLFDDALRIYFLLTFLFQTKNEVELCTILVDEVYGELSSVRNCRPSARLASMGLNMSSGGPEHIPVYTRDSGS
jgi:hypothetical protein